MVQARGVFGGASVVLVANEINLSIFKPLWLGQTNILLPDELSGDCIISPGVIQIPTSQFNLLVLPNQLQMAFAEMDDKIVVESLNRVLGGILKNLPHTPFFGLGINFDFFVGPSNSEEFAEWNKKLFASHSAMAVCEVANDHPRFGTYFSLDFEGLRLKINVRPIKGAVAAPKVIEQLQAVSEWMHFNFNFHLDLNPAAPSETALQTLAKWSLVANKTRSIISQIPG